jgi:hypothetical protein
MVTLHFAWYLLHVAMHRSRKAEKQKPIDPGTPKKIQNLPQKKIDVLGIYLPWSIALSLEI